MQQAAFRQARNLMAVVIIYFAALVAVYIGAIPIFEASDEAEHFLYIHSILESGELPTIRSRAELATAETPVERWNNHTHHPPLYYLLGALAISPTNRGDLDTYLQHNELIFVRGMEADNANKWLHPPHMPGGDTAIAVYILRSINGLLGAGTLLLIYLIARAAVRRDSVGVLAALLTASIPGYAAVHAGINNDALVIFIYAAGILWLMKTWQAAQLSNRQIALISVICAGATLSKLSGLTLTGIVLLVLAIGAWRGQFPVQRVMWSMLWIIATIALLAGWWFLRNLELYGDFFAVAATQSVWGRSAEELAQFNLLNELSLIVRSFWLMIGYSHRPLLARDTVVIYGSLITLLGLARLIRHKVPSYQRSTQLILASACGVMLLFVLVGTRAVNISYGRILYPALPAFAVLVAWGLWRTLPRGLSVLFVLPLAYASLTVPALIQQTYTPLVVAGSSQSATDTLQINSVQFNQNSIAPGQTLPVSVTFSGMHPENPYLMATVIDSITEARLGHIEVYPGMAPTNSLKSDLQYRTKLHIPLIVPAAPVPPRQIGLLLQWSTSDEPDYFAGPVILDERYLAGTPPEPRQAQFNDAIALEGYDLSQEGNQVTIRTWWRGLAAMDENWILTVQLVSAGGELITQQDGPIKGYPTSIWIPGVDVVDERTLSISPDIPAGTYQVMVAWYRLSDFERMTVTSEQTANQLLPLTEIAFLD